MGAAEGVRVDRVVITCEHGGHRVPAAQRRLFRGRERLLRSHRGWDPGALELARRLSRRLRAPLVAATTSRLVVDLNRSEWNPSLFSAVMMAGADEAEREGVLAEHYRPYRGDVERAVRAGVERGERVLHLSIHSFTPVLRGERRETDIGVLFDPRREVEARFCRGWIRALRAEGGRGRALVVQANRPYRGTDDGLTTYLRGVLGGELYLGVELEVNQRFPRRGGAGWGRVMDVVVGSLERLVAAR